MNNGRFIKASDFSKKITDWLWYPYIPYGRLTLLHGETGIGKSLFLMRLMAACTGKVKIEKDSGYLERSTVMFLTDEKDIEGLVIPKLAQAGAGLDDIYISNEELPFVLGDEYLAEMILEKGIRLMIIDPFSAYISDPEKFFSEPETFRSIILMLERIAVKTGCAIVLSIQTFPMEENLADRWIWAFRTHIASYLSMEWEENMEPEERILFHERSVFVPEGDPVNYKIGNDGLCPKSFF